MEVLKEIINLQSLVKILFLYYNYLMMELISILKDIIVLNSALERAYNQFYILILEQLLKEHQLQISILILEVFQHQLL